MSISYVSEAPVVHIHNESFAQTVNRYRREAVAHRRIYSEQRMSAVAAARLAVINMLGDARSAMAERALAGNLLDIVRFRTAQFYGTFQGFSWVDQVPDAVRRRFYYPAGEAALPWARGKRTAGRSNTTRTFEHFCEFHRHLDGC